jgi:hypothetical protein
MCRKISLCFAIIFFITLTAVAKQLVQQKIVPGVWIKSWLICGPIPLHEQKDQALSTDHLEGFKTDYLIKAGGENNLHVREGDLVKFRNGRAKWTIYNSPDSVIDLDKAVSKKDPVLAYAYTEIEADKSEIWFLSLGSNDGGTLWINGLNIWDYSLPRGLSADDDMIPVLLSRGKNTV